MITSQKLKTMIKRKVETSNLNHNTILRMVIFEFFLEKLSISKYSENFIIKGGFLVTAITKIDLRTTMDLDITLKTLTLSTKSLEKIIDEIITNPTHELLKMKLNSIEQINGNTDYPGLRATINVVFDGINETIKVDFTTGDILTPSDIQMNYQTMLEEKQLTLRSYNIETVLAEKLETILSRGILNTRMRDYYDVYMLSILKKEDININTLREALINTMKYRNTYEQNKSNFITIIEMVKQDTRLKHLWDNYQMAYQYAKEVEWDSVLKKVSEILKKIEIK